MAYLLCCRDRQSKVASVGDLPPRHRLALQTLRSAFRSFAGLTPTARQIVTNSTTSIRRSPPSYLATNDCGLWSRLARSCWVRPALFRALTIRSQKALWPSEWTDLSSLRAREAIGAGD